MYSDIKAGGVMMDNKFGGTLAPPVPTAGQFATRLEK